MFEVFLCGAEKPIAETVIARLQESFAKVTSIGKYAFCSMGKYGKDLSISIANSVTEIKDYAFKACSQIKSISIPGSVVNIGQDAFSECRN